MSYAAACEGLLLADTNSFLVCLVSFWYFTTSSSNAYRVLGSTMGYIACLLDMVMPSSHMACALDGSEAYIPGHQ